MLLLISAQRQLLFLSNWVDYPLFLSLGTPTPSPISPALPRLKAIKPICHQCLGHRVGKTSFQSQYSHLPLSKQAEASAYIVNHVLARTILSTEAAPSLRIHVLYACTCWETAVAMNSRIKVLYFIDSLFCSLCLAGFCQLVPRSQHGLGHCRSLCGFQNPHIGQACATAGHAWPAKPTQQWKARG